MSTRLLPSAPARCAVTCRSSPASRTPAAQKPARAGRHSGGQSFETFATNLALDLDAPDVLRLEVADRLTGRTCPNRLGIPAGPWVIVGFGRFGPAIARARCPAHSIHGRSTTGARARSTTNSTSWWSTATPTDALGGPTLPHRRRGGRHRQRLRPAGHHHTRPPRRPEDLCGDPAKPRCRQRADPLRANMRFVQADIMVHGVCS